ncbi:MAG: HEAT repeat domain-containing protein [Candidatus Omnitrophota bacterium]
MTPGIHRAKVVRGFRPSVRFPFQKTIAAFVLLTFTALDPSGYASQALSGSRTSAQPPASENRLLPEALGTLDEYAEGTSGKTVYFIQDAHDSLEAQEHIAGLIDHLVREKGIRTVFEEGYQGPVPTEKFFGFIKDPVLRERVSYYLLDKLRIGGAEYAHINRNKHEIRNPKFETISKKENPKNGTMHALDPEHANSAFVSELEFSDSDLGASHWRLIGVDDLKLYGENIERYRDSARFKKEIEADLGDLMTEIRGLVHRFFSKDLKAWIGMKERYEEGKIPLLSYLRGLENVLMRGEDPEAEAKPFSDQYPAVSLLLAIADSREPKQADRLNALDSAMIFRETAEMEGAIAHRFLGNERDRTIFRYHRELSLIGKLNDVKLTQEEYGAVRKALEAIDTRAIADFIVSLTGRTVVLSRAWERNIGPASRFYETAEARDEALGGPIREFLKDPAESSAILVFGGFHASRIKALLRKEKISYAVISPRIAGPDKVHQAYYREIMTRGVYRFETPFLPARATRQPSDFFMATRVGDGPVQRHLRAIAGLTESLGASTDYPILARHLDQGLGGFKDYSLSEVDWISGRGSLVLPQKLGNKAFSSRAEMRDRSDFKQSSTTVLKNFPRRARGVFDRIIRAAMIGIVGLVISLVSLNAHDDPSNSSSEAIRASSTQISNLIEQIHAEPFYRHRFFTDSPVFELERIHEPSAVPDLVQALRDQDSRVASAAAKALGNFDDPDVIVTLFGIIENDDFVANGVKAAIINSSKAMRSPENFSELTKFSKAPYLGVIQAAAADAIMPSLPFKERMKLRFKKAPISMVGVLLGSGLLIFLGGIILFGLIAGAVLKMIEVIKWIKIYISACLQLGRWCVGKDFRLLAALEARDLLTLKKLNRKDSLKLMLTDRWLFAGNEVLNTEKNMESLRRFGAPPNMIRLVKQRAIVKLLHGKVINIKNQDFLRHIDQIMDLMVFLDAMESDRAVMRNKLSAIAKEILKRESLLAFHVGALRAMAMCGDAYAKKKIEMVEKLFVELKKKHMPVDYATEKAIPILHMSARSLREFEFAIGMGMRLVRSGIPCCDILEVGVPPILSRRAKEMQIQSLLKKLEVGERTWTAETKGIRWPDLAEEHRVHRRFIREILLPAIFTNNSNKEFKSILTRALLQAEKHDVYIDEGFYDDVKQCQGSTDVPTGETYWVSKEVWQGVTLLFPDFDSLIQIVSKTRKKNRRLPRSELRNAGEQAAVESFARTGWRKPVGLWTILAAVLGFAAWESSAREYPWVVNPPPGAMPPSLEQPASRPEPVQGRAVSFEEAAKIFGEPVDQADLKKQSIAHDLALLPDTRYDFWNWPSNGKSANEALARLVQHGEASVPDILDDMAARYERSDKATLDASGMKRESSNLGFLGWHANALREIGKPAIPHIRHFLGLSGKRSYCDQLLFQVLSQIGEPAVPALIELAEKHPRAEGKELAVKVLGQLKSLESVAMFIRLLNDPKLGLFAEETLLSMGAPTVPSLIASLQGDPRPRKRVIELLAKMRDPRAIPELIRIYHEEKPYFVPAAIALSKFQDERAALAIAELASSSSLQNRKFALESLETMGQFPPSILEVLIQCLKDENEEVRALAIRVWEKTPNRYSGESYQTAVLMNQLSAVLKRLEAKKEGGLSYSEENDIEKTFETIAGLQNPATAALFLEAYGKFLELQEKKPFHSWEIKKYVNLISKVDHPKAAELLWRIYQRQCLSNKYHYRSSDDEILENALIAKGEAAAAPIMAYLEDALAEKEIPQDAVRRVIGLLADIEEADTEALFIRFLESTNIEAKAAAILALSKRKNPELATRLREFLKDSDGRVRGAAVEARHLFSGAEYNPFLKQALDLEFQAWNDRPSWGGAKDEFFAGLVNKIFSKIAENDPREARELLLDKFKTGTPRERIFAATELGKWGTPDMAPFLWKVYKKTGGFFDLGALARDPNLLAQFQSQAAVALSMMGDPRSKPVLIAFLANENSAIVNLAKAELIRSGDEKGTFYVQLMTGDLEHARRHREWLSWSRKAITHPSPSIRDRAWQLLHEGNELTLWNKYRFNMAAHPFLTLLLTGLSMFPLYFFIKHLFANGVLFWGRMKRPSAIPALLFLLKTKYSFPENEQIIDYRHTAARVLGGYGVHAPPVVVKTMLEILNQKSQHYYYDGSRSQVIAIATALSHFRDPAIEPALIGLMMQSAAPDDVHNAIASTLQRIGSARALFFFHLYHGRIGDAAKVPQADQYAREAIQKGCVTIQRSAALVAAELGKEDATPVLVSALADEKPDYRDLAVKGLEKIPSDEAQFFYHLYQKNIQKASQVPHAAEFIPKALEHKNIALKRYAPLVGAELALKDMGPLLVPALADPDLVYRELVIRAMSKIPSYEANFYFYLYHKNIQKAFEVPSAAEFIAAALEHKNDTVRETAYWVARDLLLTGRLRKQTDPSLIAESVEALILKLKAAAAPRTADDPVLANRLHRTHTVSFYAIPSQHAKARSLEEFHASAFGKFGPLLATRREGVILPFIGDFFMVDEAVRTSNGRIKLTVRKLPDDQIYGHYGLVKLKAPSGEPYQMEWHSLRDVVGRLSMLPGQFGWVAREGQGREAPLNGFADLLTAVSHKDPLRFEPARLEMKGFGTVRIRAVHNVFDTETGEPIQLMPTLRSEVPRELDFTLLDSDGKTVLTKDFRAFLEMPGALPGTNYQPHFHSPPGLEEGDQSGRETEHMASVIGNSVSMPNHPFFHWSFKDRLAKQDRTYGVTIRMSKSKAEALRLRELLHEYDQFGADSILGGWAKRGLVFEKLKDFMYRTGLNVRGMNHSDLYLFPNGNLREDEYTDTYGGIVRTVYGRAVGGLMQAQPAFDMVLNNYSMNGDLADLGEYIKGSGTGDFAVQYLLHFLGRGIDEFEKRGLLTSDEAHGSKSHELMARYLDGVYAIGIEGAGAGSNVTAQISETPLPKPEIFELASTEFPETSTSYDESGYSSEYATGHTLKNFSIKIKAPSAEAVLRKAGSGTAIRNVYSNPSDSAVEKAFQTASKEFEKTQPKANPGSYSYPKEPPKEKEPISVQFQHLVTAFETSWKNAWPGGASANPQAFEAKDLFLGIAQASMNHDYQVAYGSVKTELPKAIERFNQLVAEMKEGKASWLRSELRSAREEPAGVLTPQQDAVRRFDQSTQREIADIQKQVPRADLVILVPFYDEIDEAVGRGARGTDGKDLDIRRLVATIKDSVKDLLARHGLTRALILCVGESAEGDGRKTLEAVRGVEDRGDPEIPVWVYGKEPEFKGLIGKKWAQRLGMRVAEKLGAHFADIDGDMTVDNAYVTKLIGPVLSGSSDYVSPQYLRYYGFDDIPIIDHLVYPFFKALYGSEIRQPNTGEFAVSRSLLRTYLEDEDIWTAPAPFEAHFAAHAVVLGKTVTDTRMGEKIHKANPLQKKAEAGKSPSSNFPLYFKVVFDAYAAQWKRGLALSSEGPLENSAEPPLSEALPASAAEEIYQGARGLDAEAWHREAVAEYRQHTEFYRAHFPEEVVSILERRLGKERDEDLWKASEWALVAAFFLRRYMDAPAEARDGLLEALRPVFKARIASFLEETQGATGERAEALLRDQAAEFARIVPRVLSRRSEVRNAEADEVSEANRKMREVYDAVFAKIASRPDFDPERLTSNAEHYDRDGKPLHGEAVGLHLLVGQQEGGEALMGRIHEIQSEWTETFGLQGDEVTWIADDYLHVSGYIPVKVFTPDLPEGIFSESTAAAVREAVSTVESFPIDWKGITIDEKGSILLQGFVESMDVFRLRAALDRIFRKPGYESPFMPNIVHITVGRIRKPLGPDRFASLRKWAEANRDTPRGRLGAKRLSFIRATLREGQRVGEESFSVPYHFDFPEAPRSELRSDGVPPDAKKAPGRGPLSGKAESFIHQRLTPDKFSILDDNRNHAAHNILKVLAQGKLPVVFPYQIQLDLTQFCPFWDAIQRTGRGFKDCINCSFPVKSRRQVDPKVLTKILGNFEMHGGRSVFVTGGGEPGAYEHWHDLLVFLSNSKLGLTLNTNGMFVRQLAKEDPEILRKVFAEEKDPSVISISVHGTYAYRLAAQLDELRRRLGLNIVIRNTYMIHPDTPIAELTEFLEKSQEAGVDMVSFKPEHILRGDRRVFATNENAYQYLRNLLFQQEAIDKGMPERGHPYRLVITAMRPNRLGTDFEQVRKLYQRQIDSDHDPLCLGPLCNLYLNTALLMGMCCDTKDTGIGGAPAEVFADSMFVLDRPQDYFLAAMFGMIKLNPKNCIVGCGFMEPNFTYSATLGLTYLTDTLKALRAAFRRGEMTEAHIKEHLRKAFVDTTREIAEDGKGPSRAEMRLAPLLRSLNEEGRAAGSSLRQGSLKRRAEVRNSFSPVSALPMWDHIRNELESYDPQIRLKTQGYLPRLYHALRRLIAGIQEKVDRGEIAPDAFLKMYRYRDRQDALPERRLDRPLRVGFFPVANNPFNWGHLLVAFTAMERLNLDTVIFRVHGEIKYKRVPQSDKVPPEERHPLSEKVIRNHYFPFFRYTDLGLRDDVDGYTALFEYAGELEPDRDIDFYFIMGSETEGRVSQFTDVFYQGIKKYGVSPHHKMNWVLMQRGEYGRTLTQEAADRFMIERAEALGVEQPIPVHVLTGPDVDLNIYSTYYREGGDEATVPREVHAFGVQHQYWGNRLDEHGAYVDRVTAFRADLQPIVGEIADRIIEARDRKTPVNPFGLFAFDGPSGAGKTTVVEEVQAELQRRGYHVVHLGLDVLLRTPGWRRKIEEYVTGEKADPRGKIKAGIYLNEAAFFRARSIQRLFREILRFRDSGEAQKEFHVRNAYRRVREDEGPSIVPSFDFTLTRDTILLVDGKYAQYYHEPSLAGLYDLSFRIQDNPGRNIALFQKRSRHLKPAEELRKLVFYDRALQPSYERYTKETAALFDYEIDLTREFFSLVPNAKRSPAGSPADRRESQTAPKDEKPGPRAEVRDDPLHEVVSQWADIFSGLPEEGARRLWRQGLHDIREDLGRGDGEAVRIERILTEFDPRRADPAKGIVTAYGYSASAFFDPANPEQTDLVRLLSGKQMEIVQAFGADQLVLVPSGYDPVRKVVTSPQGSLHMTLGPIAHNTEKAVPREELLASAEKIRATVPGQGRIRGRLIGPFWHKDLAIVMVWVPEAEHDPLLELKEGIGEALGNPITLRPFHVTLAYLKQGVFTGKEFREAYAKMAEIPLDVIPAEISRFEVNGYGDIAFIDTTRDTGAVIDLEPIEQRDTELAPVPLTVPLPEDSKRAEVREGMRVLESMPLAAGKVIRQVRQGALPAMVFVDAGDFSAMSAAQKNEFFYAVSSRSEVRLVVYNERGQVEDRELAALLKMPGVLRTERDLEGASIRFGRANVPSIHLSRNVPVSRELLGRFGRKVAFFRTTGEKSGTLATALLWAVSGGEEARIPGVDRSSEGYWTVSESLLNTLDRQYANDLVVSIAA